MSERQPQPNPEQQREEVLRTGRNLYDAVRPLFDISNNLGLRVDYYARISERPHLSDRAICAQFQPTEEDMFEPVPGIQLGFPSNQVVDVSLILFSPNPNGSVTPDGIRVFIGKNSQYPVGLQPNGDIDPTVDERSREREIARTHSTFRLVAKLAETGRLHPNDDFEIIIHPRKPKVELPDFGITVRPKPPIQVEAPEPIVITEEQLTTGPEIVITHRDVARNPIEWVQGTIKDIRDSHQEK